MKLYKLTDAQGQTYGGTQWGEGVEHTAPGKGSLCSAGWIHAYTDPLLAMLLNPIHGNFTNPILWEAEGEVGATDHGLKVGCVRLTTVCVVLVPEITMEQRVRFGILCALQVCQDHDFVEWAKTWLSGKDRSAKAAARAAEAAAEAAAWAREAAWAAARAAEAAAWAREAAWAAEAAARAAEAEWAAARAAEAAAAAREREDLDLALIAQEACKQS